MARPLDHVTVLQQINFAERVHQDSQTHPEVSMLKARDSHLMQRLAERQRPNLVPQTRRTGVRLHGENYHQTTHSTGNQVDIKA